MPPSALPMISSKRAQTSGAIGGSVVVVVVDDVDEDDEDDEDVVEGGGVDGGAEPEMTPAGTASAAPTASRARPWAAPGRMNRRRVVTSEIMARPQGLRRSCPFPGDGAGRAYTPQA